MTPETRAADLISQLRRLAAQHRDAPAYLAAVEGATAELACRLDDLSTCVAEVERRRELLTTCCDRLDHHRERGLVVARRRPPGPAGGTG